MSEEYFFLRYSLHQFTCLFQNSNEAPKHEPWLRLGIFIIHSLKSPTLQEKFYKILVADDKTNHKKHIRNHKKHIRKEGVRSQNEFGRCILSSEFCLLYSLFLLCLLCSLFVFFVV
jgi:hypothetical protein